MPGASMDVVWRRVTLNLLTISVLAAAFGSAFFCGFDSASPDYSRVCAGVDVARFAVGAVQIVLFLVVNYKFGVLAATGMTFALFVLASVARIAIAGLCLNKWLVALLLCMVIVSFLYWTSKNKEKKTAGDDEKRTAPAVC